jgi:hypothetical protein
MDLNLRSSLTRIWKLNLLLSLIWTKIGDDAFMVSTPLSSYICRSRLPSFDNPNTKLRYNQKNDCFHVLQTYPSNYDILDATIIGEKNTHSSDSHFPSDDELLAVHDEESTNINIDEKNELKTEAPTVSKILNFALPAIGV